MKKNSVVSVVRYSILIVVQYNSLVSVVSEEKQRSERSQIFHFNNSEVKWRSERSQRFHFSVTYAKKVVFQWLVLQQQ